mmetsp:Transcript_9014/g.13581  ORF Transcript_9014/g.13581 Transcript_9014/m.13581 type:complete len:103 (+) Transcript_9014:1763-2071(+)
MFLYPNTVVSDRVSYEKYDFHDRVKSVTPSYQCVALTAFESPPPSPSSLESEEDILGKGVELNSNGGSSTNMSNGFFFELDDEDDEFHIRRIVAAYRRANGR